MSSSLLSPEARALLATITGNAAAARSAVEHPGFDWDRLVSLAIQEKAAAGLPVLLELLPPDGIPAEARQNVDGMVRATQFRMLRLEQLLIGALDTLRREGIDVVLLKGAGLATTVYGSFAARPMYDLDLLVRPEHATRAWNVLRASGWVHDAVECPPAFYESHYHLPPLDDAAGTGLALELHTALTDGAVLLPGEMIWQDARAIDVRGRRAFVPSPTHQVLHLAAHFAWTHGMASAAWRTFRDLQEILSRTELDWDDIMRATRIARAETCCYWTLRLAASLAAVAVPEDVLDALQPPRAGRMLALLERHYTSVLFQFSPAACPSVRLTQMLWSAGMLPRWSGHGRVRPWHRGHAWALHSGGAGPRPLFDRLRGHARRGAQWSRYLTGLAAFRDRTASA